MSGHTQGPWKASESDPAEGAHVFWITAPQGCGQHNGEVDITSVPGNKPANAHLIAAAPDLLKALKNILRRFENCARFSGSEDWAIDAATKKARAALAKAEGRTESC